MRILVLSPYLPHHRIGHGGGISTYKMLVYMAAHHDVTCLCFRRSGEESFAEDLTSRGVRVVPVDFRSDHDSGLDRVALIADRLRCLARSWRSGWPLEVEKYARAEFTERLDDLLSSDPPDVLFIEFTKMASYARNRFDKQGPLGDKDSKLHVVLNTHEAGSLPRIRRLMVSRSRWQQWRHAVELRRWARFERTAMSWPDTVLCVTDQDRRFLESLSARDGFLEFPLGVDARELPRAQCQYTSPPRLLFVGNYQHLPNCDAAALLIDEIMPRILQHRPDVELDLVGAHLPPAIALRAAGLGSAVNVHGFVESLDEVHDNAWLFVAPLFSGGGIKIKILEAMTRANAVLTTDIGLEGIDARGEEDVVVATSAEHFTRRALELIEDPDRLRQLSASGRERVASLYSWDATVNRLMTQLEGRTDGPRRR